MQKSFNPALLNINNNFLKDFKIVKYSINILLQRSADTLTIEITVSKLMIWPWNVQSPAEKIHTYPGEVRSLEIPRGWGSYKSKF